MNIRYQGNYLKVISSEVDPSWEFVDERDLVFVLPVIYTGEDKLIGIRKEFIPPYASKSDFEFFYTAISGGIEKGELRLDAAERELREEAGITLLEFQGIGLFKNKFLCKTTNVRATAYLYKITKYISKEAVGDGSYAESVSKTVWVKFDELMKLIGIERVDMILQSVVLAAKDQI